MLQHMLRAVVIPSYTASYVTTSYFSIGPSNATSTSLTFSNSIRTGDIIFLNIGLGDSNSATPPTATIPFGYTLINSQDSYSVLQADASNSYCLYKIAGPADIGGTLTVTHTNCNYRGMQAAFFRFTKPISPTISLSSVNTYGSKVGMTGPVAPTDQTVVTQGAVFPLIVIGHCNNNNTMTFSPTADGSLLNGILSYKIYNSSPSSNVTVGSPTVTDQVISLQSFYMSLS